MDTPEEARLVTLRIWVGPEAAVVGMHQEIYWFSDVQRAFNMLCAFGTDTAVMVPSFSMARGLLRALGADEVAADRAITGARYGLSSVS